jgi:hypothetical protein
MANPLRMKYSFFLFLTISSTGAFGQNIVPTRIKAQTTLTKLSSGYSPGQVMQGIAQPLGDVIGDGYLNDTWNVGTIMLFESEKIVESVPLKYNIQQDQLELMTGDVIRAIDGIKIKSVIWIDSITRVPVYYINAKGYQLDGTKLNGLLEVVVDGVFPLFKRTTIIEKEANYVKEFDVGSRDKKLEKKEVFYYSNNHDLVKIKNKKSLLPAFQLEAQNVDNFIKINSLDVKSQNGLTRIFEYYNSKIASTQ